MTDERSAALYLSKFVTLVLTTTNSGRLESSPYHFLWHRYALSSVISTSHLFLLLGSRMLYPTHSRRSFLPVHSLSLGLIVVSRFMSTLLMFLSIHSLFPWQSRSNTSIRIPLFTYSNVSRCLQARLLPHRIPHTMIPLQLFLCLRSYPHCPSCWYLSNVVYPTSIGT